MAELGKLRVFSGKWPPSIGYCTNSRRRNMVFLSMPFWDNLLQHAGCRGRGSRKEGRQGGRRAAGSLWHYVASLNRWLAHALRLKSLTLGHREKELWSDALRTTLQPGKLFFPSFFPSFFPFHLFLAHSNLCLFLFKALILQCCYSASSLNIALTITRESALCKIHGPAACWA